MIVTKKLYLIQTKTDIDGKIVLKIKNKPFASQFSFKTS